MDLDELKPMWNEMNRRLDKLERENKELALRIQQQRYKSSQEKLAGKYRGIMFLESVMIVFTWLYLIGNPYVDERFRWPTIVYWTFFFLFELCFDFYLLLKLKQIDIYHSTVAEIAALASRNWRRQKQGIVIGIPIAIGAVILYALCMNANAFVYAGMAVGGILGLAIGLRQLMKFREHYRTLYSND